MVVQFSNISVMSFGKTIEEAFANAASDVLSHMGKLSKGKEDIKFEVQIKASTLQELFIEWLTDILEKSETQFIDVIKTPAKIGKFGNSYFLHGHVIGKKSKNEINNISSIKLIANTTVEIDEQHNKFAVRVEGL